MAHDGVGLPVRLHDFLLALAGRVDDDALSQARELLAVAEPDRAAELVVGCLLAGRIPVTGDERRELGAVLREVRSDPALADRLLAVEHLPYLRHRFSSDSDPAEGLSEALAKTVSSLPDVRGVRASWRSSPAGATPGPLPQRVVLVDIGPKGFAPATAYRVDVALRRAGIRAAVEVLTVGTPLGDYHASAVTAAREVFFPAVPVDQPVDNATWFDGEVRDKAPVVEPEPVPAEPETGSKARRARADSFEGVQPFPPKPVKRLPVREPVEEELPKPPALEEPPLSRSEVTTELNPDDLAALQAALAEGEAPATAALSQPVDAKLSERERALLQQLHEELAQREQSTWPAGGPEYVNGVPKPNNGNYPG
ncbi:hypothetical protein [Saccharothrix coeruleofusca]|uniref:Uncharacterized protein n=1 Tax=Saccharothrix coeruleofusca TaxID=33919 RepID=A0A918EAT4_9PSEU|nr:hypothetical protein [Saccharothrix coeruleofusca]MBP2340300.1 hypothetical protein [Saccharothrix coeruleofusca]GGP36320.1 hypothetical protein GCM10010185_04270 [Saccharothrix coeruleofusca]